MLHNGTCLCIFIFFFLSFQIRNYYERHRKIRFLFFFITYCKDTSSNEHFIVNVSLNSCLCLLPQGLRQNQNLRFQLHLFCESPCLESNLEYLHIYIYLSLLFPVELLVHCHSHSLPTIWQRSQNDQ
jgi:hypothetical protein